MWRFFIFNQFLISLTSSLKNEKKILSLPPGSSNSKRTFFHLRMASCYSTFPIPVFAIRYEYFLLTPLAFILYNNITCNIQISFKTEFYNIAPFLSQQRKILTL